MTTILTHRRRSSELKDGHVIQFAAADTKCGNDHYGDHVWALETELPEVPEEVIEFAAEYFGCELDEAESLCNPAKIVESAGVWDDRQFVSDCWQRFECAGFRTPDGAVVLDRYAVEIRKIA